MTQPWESAQPVHEARALAVSLCAALADWAASTGEDVLLREYLRGSARAVD